MNNRFKFRAVLKNKEDYLSEPFLKNDIFDVISIGFNDNGIQTVTLLGFHYNGDYSIYEADAEECELMQCTGLKDKNGKLIYEGDIIQIQGDTGKAKVEYNLEKGMFLLVGKKYAPSAFMTIRKDYWEVIGNIYTNADLLQDCE